MRYSAAPSASSASRCAAAAACCCLRAAVRNPAERRSGFLTSARKQRQAEAAAQRDAELADGAAEYRIAGYVTVTAADPDALEVACADITAAATAARLQLLRLYGQHDRAFTYTLPLGRGLT